MVGTGTKATLITKITEKTQNQNIVKKNKESEWIGSQEK